MNTPIPKKFSNRPLWDVCSIPFYKEEDKSVSEHFWEETDGIERLTDVTNPTITFFPATALGNEPRPAVLVCPGGAYSILAWNHEGIDIASWLTTQGFHAFLLKYRCPGRRDDALADAARAMRFIRANAESLCVIPEKVGIIGFSAGAHLSARLSCLPEGKEPYPVKDAIDTLSPRPNFQLLIYPAYIDREWTGVDPDFEIKNGQTPKAFIMQSEDDTLIKSSISYFINLKENNIPAEMHIFPRGGHGYGLVYNGNPTENWTRLAGEWLRREVR